MIRPSKQEEAFASLDKRFEIMQRFIRVKLQYEPEFTSDKGRTMFLAMLKDGWHNRYPFAKEEELVLQIWDSAWDKVMKSPATN